MKFFSVLAGAALVALTAAAPAPANAKGLAARAESAVAPTPRSDLSEDTIIWIIAAYSDEAEGADKIKREMTKRSSLPKKDGENETEVLILLVAAYGDEAEGADKFKRSVSPEQMSAVKRTVINKLNA